MASRKKAEPFKGSKDVERATKEGRDPNADLTEKDKSQTTAQAALSLKLSGASYTQIAQMLDYSSAYRARSAVERVLASAADSAEDRDMMRELTKRRLDRLLQSVMGKAVDTSDPEHLAYNARALAIIDRSAKMYGLDAPTQVQITPTHEKVQEYLQKFTEVVGADKDAEEADIMDAEIIEDDE